jgi:hypothetical protein
MRLDSSRTGGHIAERLDFMVRNRRSDTSAAYEAENSSGREDVEPTLKIHSYEDIARKERQVNIFGSVLPVMNLLIKWQEGFKPFARKLAFHMPFVLMLRVYGIPGHASRIVCDARRDGKTGWVSHGSAL